MDVRIDTAEQAGKIRLAINAIVTGATLQDRFLGIENLINEIALVVKRNTSNTSILSINRPILQLIKAALEETLLTFYCGAEATEQPKELPFAKTIHLAILNGSFPWPITRLIARLGSSVEESYERLYKRSIDIIGTLKKVIESDSLLRSYNEAQFQSICELISFFDSLQTTQQDALTSSTSVSSSSSSSSFSSLSSSLPSIFGSHASGASSTSTTSLKPSPLPIHQSR